MATLFKLAIDVDVETTVLTKPNVMKYFYTVNPDHIDQGVLTIPADAFVDDNDNPVETITLATSDNGYYLLFINGVLQEDSLYTVTANSVEVQNADEIIENAVIVLVVTNFEPDATTQTTVQT